MFSRHGYDSQGQANRFIKTMGKDPSFSLNGIDVIKLTDKNFLRTLENGLRFGRWVLLENVQARVTPTSEANRLCQRYSRSQQALKNARLH